MKNDKSPVTNIIVFFTFALLIFIGFGCTDFGTSPGDSTNNSNVSAPFDTVSFSTEIRDTLVIFCGQVGCHGGGTVQGGLLLGAISWNEIVNASGDHGPVIVPGNASLSNLYKKLTDTPPFGDRMPQGGPYLSDRFQKIVRDWIDQGALNN